MVPASPRVAGPVSARSIPRVRALATVCSTQRQVDRQRARLVQPDHRRDLADRVQQRHDAAGREHRCRVVRRLGARRQPDRDGRRSPRPSRPGAPRARRRPRSRSSRRRAPRVPGRGPRTRPAGGTRRPAVPAAMAGWSTSAPSSPLVWIMAWPAYRRRRPRERLDDVVRHREHDELDVVHERVRLGEGADARDEPRNRSRRPGSREATAPTGQPARDSATPSAVPTAPAPTMPTTGRSPGPACACGWAWSLACSRSPWRCVAPGSPSRPAIGRLPHRLPAGARPRGRIEVDPVRAPGPGASPRASSAPRSAWRRRTSSPSSQALIRPRRRAPCGARYASTRRV